jgi:hypothetical protein
MATAAAMIGAVTIRAYRRTKSCPTHFSKRLKKGSAMVAIGYPVKCASLVQIQPGHNARIDWRQSFEIRLRNIGMVGYYSPTHSAKPVSAGPGN